MEKISAKAGPRAAARSTRSGHGFTPSRTTPGVALAWLLSGWLMAVAPYAAAQSSTPPPPDEEWTVRDTYGFRSRNLGTGALMQIRIDGSTPSSAKSSFKRTSTDREENETALDFDAEYAPRQNIALRREMRVDPKRRAVRILDIISNTDSQERSVRVDYSTTLSERGSARYGGVLNQAGESREYGNGVPDDTVAALVFAERQGSQALPLFVWGQASARWPVNFQDLSSTVSLNYEGVIPANGKVALLHWVAVAGLDKNVKLERTADLFWKDGRLVNPMVSAEMAPLVVNFTPEALKTASAAPSVAHVQPAGKLLHFEGLCAKLSVARGDEDVLWMGADEQLRGEVTGTTVQVKTGSRTVTVPLADIAGIRGGGGRGREHRVYLRNGAVLTGRASLGDCRLAGELGHLTLDADALELLLLRVTAEDGKAPEGVSGFIELQDGAVHWLTGQEVASLQYVTVFGGLPISLGEVWSLERRTEPPFNLIAALADGSRIHGVAQQPALTLPVRDADGKTVPTPVRVAEVVRLGSSKLLIQEMALPGSGAAPKGDSGSTKPKAEPPARYCWLRDGSLLVGAITSPTLRVRTGGNDVDLKSEDIARMTLDAASGNLASIELRSGAKMQGELLSESFDWQLGSRKVSLPAGWVQEVIRKDIAEPAPAEAPATTQTPAENDPLALPKGVPKEDLVEEKPSYPKRMFIGELKPLGDLANLETPSPEEVKKRSTFLIPRGAVNVAKGKKVTASDPLPIIGSLDLITDGDADGSDGCYVEMAPGLQWVQIDLGASHHIWKVLLWHMHKQALVYHDVIVQVSDDPDFKTGVQTIFSNDDDNSAGFGKGPDPTYVETNFGKLMDGCGAKGRYVRFYSNQNTANEMNHYIEASVYGTPVTGKVDAPGTMAPGAAKPAASAPQAPASPPSAATNKPNDADRVPTGFSKEDMVTTGMTFPTVSPTFPKPISASKFPHLEQAPRFDPRVAPSLRLTYPKGGKNVSKGKPVTSSDKPTNRRDISAFVDSMTGNLSYIELPKGQQWMQIDLGARHHIWKVALWLYHYEHAAAVDLIVQVSDDESFAKDVTTLFNNDHDNSSGMGRGADPAYVETIAGRVMDGCDAKARYVRVYTNGSSDGDVNRFTEAMVFGTPLDAAAPAKAAEIPMAEESSPASSAPASGTLSTKPTPAQLASTAAHQKPRDPFALPPGIPESELVTIRPLHPKGSSVPSAWYGQKRVDHQQEHDVKVLQKTSALRVPAGTVRVSIGKPVTTSDSKHAGSKDLAYVTDGHLREQQSPFLHLSEGLHCVQIDLLAQHHIWKVLLWHDATRFDLYEDVIVQLSNDPEFAKEVVTIFNNDADDTSGLGKGPDPAYIETYYGRLMDGGGHKARYVRFYSRGNTTDGKNCYLEAAVYGTRVGGEEKPAPLPNEPMPTVPNNPLAVPRTTARDTVVTLSPTYPKALYVTPPVIEAERDVPHLEKPDPEATRQRLSFPVSRWSHNVAERKLVTSSAPPVDKDSLSRLVDGNPDGVKENVVTLPLGTQWVQVDLGERKYIGKVLLWHAFFQWNIVHDVVVQVSDDAAFASGVQTIFNNDHDNSAGLGKGADPAYVETNLGRLIDGCDARGRYLRVTTRGSTASPLNRFTEIMVFGKRPPRVSVGLEAGEKPVTLSDLRTLEDANASTDTTNFTPGYPAPAPGAAAFASAQVDASKFPHLEKRDWIQEHMRLRFAAPMRAYQNVAKNKPVTTSAPGVPEEDLKRATNGAAFHDDVLELPPGLQWVQVDLGAEYRLWNILLWHNHSRPVVYQDVVVQISSDPKFEKGVVTVFNNDHDNSSGLGKGKEPAYVETNFGRHMEVPGVLGRYVRFYSNGNSENGANHFCETSVYGAFEEGIAGSTKPEGDAMSFLPYSTIKGTLVSYTTEFQSYTMSFPNGGPVTVQKTEFPHLETFDYERERTRMFIPRPNTVRLLTCESFSTSASEVDAKELRRLADGTTSTTFELALPGGLQWMQVDLGKVRELWFVRLWHHINDPVVYHDVVVQASEDPEFKTGVHTLFNNDHDNSSGLGKGTDPAYLETQFGRLIPGLATRARYLRVYSRGNSREDVNRFAEIKVYGREVAAPGPSASNSAAPVSNAPMPNTADAAVAAARAARARAEAAMKAAFDARKAGASPAEVEAAMARGRAEINAAAEASRAAAKAMMDAAKARRAGFRAGNPAEETAAAPSAATNP